jgi:hypothetical protein
MSSKFLGMVRNEVEKEVHSQLNASAGGCLQFDGWTDPAGAQVFAVLYGALLPFYVTTFRIVCLRESFTNLVEKIKEVMSRLWPVARETLRPPLWHECRNVAAVTDSPYVMVRARKDMVEAGMFFVAYGCSAHARSNLCKDVLKLPSANKPLVLCTIIAKFFGNRHLPRAHLRAQCLLEPGSKPPMSMLPSPTRWTGAARLFVTVSMNRNAIDEVFRKARRKTFLTWTVPPN